MNIEVLVVVLTAGLGIVVYWVNRWHEITTQAIGSLQVKRLERLPALWKSVAAICTPSPGSEEDGHERSEANAKEFPEPSQIPCLARSKLQRALQELSDWYACDGVYLDASSRLWVLLLREACTKAIRDSKPDAEFPWEDEVWPTLWLVKTALRVSLESAVSAPVMRGGRAWPKRGAVSAYFKRRSLCQQLALKFSIVDELAPSSKKGRDRQLLIERVLDAYFVGESSRLLGGVR